MGRSKPRVVAIVQARMASSRLPGKVLADVVGQPMLIRVVERTRRATTVDKLIVATTTEPGDEAVSQLCLERDYACFRGDSMDVLDRFVQAARLHQAEAVVRVTGDCPLIDPEVIDQTVSAFLEADPPVDFAANRLPRERSFPIGLDTEVCWTAVLERAWREADRPYQREHVMPYLYESPERFRTLLIHSPQDYGHMRWTVDTAQDLEVVRRIYEHFHGDDRFGWRQVLELLERKPELARLNARVPHKTESDLDKRWTEGG